MTRVESLISKLNKEMKSGSISIGADFEDVECIPSSSLRLTYSLHGGLPIGRIIEFSGADSSGKTTTAIDFMKNAQKMFPDKYILFCDIESTFDERWAQKLGLDLEHNFIIYRPDSADAEEVFQKLLELLDTGDICFCVLDSIGAMVSGQENKKEIKDRTYAGISQALTRFSKKLISVCYRNKCTFIGINQVREDLNSQYGGLTTVGGKAWRHNCSVRLSFRKGSFIDDKGNQVSRAVENPAGNLVLFNLEKSKVCASDRKTGFYTIRYLTGIDYISDTVDLAIKEDIIHQAGAWYSIIDKDTGEILEYPIDDNNDNMLLKFQGKTKLIEYLSIYTKVYEMIVNKVMSCISD